jgi:hypothetical protein
MIEEYATLYYCQRVVRYAFGAANHVLPPRPVRTACMRGTATADLVDDRAACQKTSKQTAGNRHSASTCFLASRARMELAMVVYIFAQARVSWACLHTCSECERKMRAQAGQQARGGHSDGYLGLAQLSLQPQRPTYAAWYTLFKACRTNVRALA